ncbi:MAG: hypothetical protein QXL51_01000 [Candidatus Aenigmatarchaeota archaeon]
MVDAVQFVKTILEAEWDSSKTDNKIPIFIHSYDDKDLNNTIRLSSASQDVIRIYERSPQTMQVSGIGTNRWDYIYYITIDVFIASNKIHAQKVKEHLTEIINNKINLNKDEFQYIIADYKIQNFSGVQYNKLWRWVFEIELVKFNAEV